MTPKRHRLALLVVLAGFLPGALAATSYVPMADAELADQAQLVVRARVVAAEAGPFGEAPSTDYTVDLERVLGGFAPGTTLIVRVPGGSDGEGRRLKIWGAPEFEVGERALLFLTPRADGTFGVLHLMLGAFHERRLGGQAVFERDLRGVHAVGGASGPEPVRLARRFEDWLADRALGIERPVDYLGDAGIGRARSEFTYISAPPVRWPDFDRGAAVSWRAHEGGQSTIAGGGIAEFRQALAAWNDDGATNIRYDYAGTTAATGGLRRFDDVNAILFHDPRADADGTFSCSGGGVLAVGGPWLDDEAADVYSIVGADIVVNDGTGCWFEGGAQGRLRAAEVYAHELGHTLGLGHACGDDESGPCDSLEKSVALMAAQAKRLSGGAVLGSDDRAAILGLYPPKPAGGGGGGGGGLTAPAGLAASATRTTIRLSWLDGSGESAYLIEVRSPPRRFRQVASVRRNVTEHVVRGLRPNTLYELRLRAKAGRREFSAFSETLTIRTAP